MANLKRGEMTRNSGGDRTPKDDRKDHEDEADGELTNEELREKMKKMSKKINSLERRTDKMKKWRQKCNLSVHKAKKKGVTPVHLDFESEEEELEEKEQKQTFSDVETDQENPDWDSEKEGLPPPEGSPTRSLSVFDRLGNKLNNKDLCHRLNGNMDRRTRKSRSGGSQSRGSHSQRKQRSGSRSTRLPSEHDDERSSSSQHDPKRSQQESSTGTTDEDGSEFTGSSDEHYKVKDLRDALKRLKSEKQSQSDLEVATPFTRKVKESPLPRSYKGVGDLKFDGTSDPVEFLSQFNIEMEVYQIEDLIKCRLLAVALRDSAHQWFKRLFENSVRSWRQMSRLFITQFQDSVAFAPRPTH